jgi:hypothetical protein
MNREEAPGTTCLALIEPEAAELLRSSRPLRQRCSPIRRRFHRIRGEVRIPRRLPPGMTSSLPIIGEPWLAASSWRSM